MGFRFPDPGAEVRLARPPLTEVIYQVRFSPILRIDQETPAAFQEMVRRDLPELEAVRAWMGSPTAVRSGLLETGPIHHRFKSADGVRMVTLAAEFMSVSTTRYTHWNEFFELVAKATEALQTVYEPSHCTRLGLRFVNAITPALVGAQSLEAAEALLNERLRSAFLSDLLDDAIETLCQVRAVIAAHELERECFTLRSGLAEIDGGERGYLLDFDCYADGNVSLEGLRQRCDRFHEWIYRAFRWSLAPEALVAFRAEEV